MKTPAGIFFILFCILLYPSSSRAQVPGWGGFFLFMYPVTCSIPPLPPHLALPPPKLCLNYPIPTPNLPPAFTFDFFGPLYLPVPTPGILAVPIGTVPAFTPGLPLAPGMWALGSAFIPGGPIGGFFIPGFTVYYPSGPPMCVESTCVPIAQAIGTLTPAFGVGAGFGGFF